MKIIIMSGQISNDIILNVRYYNMYWVGAILFCQILMLVITLTNYGWILQEMYQYIYVRLSYQRVFVACTLSIYKSRYTVKGLTVAPYNFKKIFDVQEDIKIKMKIKYATL